MSPTLSAYLMQSFSLNVPIFIGGFLQLFHDCVFYLLFRNGDLQKKSPEGNPNQHVSRSPPRRQTSDDSRGIRAFAFSYLGVVFAIYLDRLGYSTVVVGMIFSVAYISSALLTALWGYLSDRLGRRRILMLLAALTIVSNVIYIF